MNDAECVDLLQWAAPSLGLRWRGFTRVRGQVCKRIARRIHALGLADAAAYRQRLQEDAEEWKVLDALCRVTISRFYRDRAVWDVMMTRLLPERAEAALKGERSLRCWSAGCASGEEPWTLSLMLQLAIAPRVPELTWSILATDADEALLGRAERACYRSSTLRELPSSWKEQAFEAEEDLFCLRARFRQGVSFKVADVRGPPPDEPIDLLMCRNVAFTYLDRTVQSEVLAAFCTRLLPGAWLITGAHESLPRGAEERFRLERMGSLPIYRFSPNPSP